MLGAEGPHGSVLAPLEALIAAPLEEMLNRVAKRCEEGEKESQRDEKEVQITTEYNNEKMICPSICHKHALGYHSYDIKCLTRLGVLNTWKRHRDGEGGGSGGMGEGGGEGEGGMGEG